MTIPVIAFVYLLALAGKLRRRSSSARPLLGFPEYDTWHKATVSTRRQPCAPHLSEISQEFRSGELLSLVNEIGPIDRAHRDGDEADGPQELRH